MRTILIAILAVAAFAMAAIVAEAQATCPVAQITSPSPGSALPGSTVTFSWCNAGGDYFLTVESVLGAHDIFYAVVRVTSVTLINVPTNAKPIYVTLWTQLGGSWQSPFQYTYTAAGASAPPASPAPNYTLTPTATKLSIARGQSGTIQVTMTPTNGFDGTVAFNCSGLPITVSCQFTPAQVAGPATSTLVISVSAAFAANQGPAGQNQRRTGLLLALWSLGASAFGLVSAGPRQARWRTPASLLIVGLALLILLAGCGGGSSTPVTQPAAAAQTNPPQPATGPQTISAAVTATATGGTQTAANPNQQFQIQITVP